MAVLLRQRAAAQVTWIPRGCDGSLSMAVKQVEIICSSCGDDALLIRSPIYDGFKKIGERLTCAQCGHEYANEDSVPFKQERHAQVFVDSDAPRKVVVFREDEKGRTCRYCENYVVNPFTQRCGIRMKTVEATDTCADFTRKQEKSGTSEQGTPP